MRFVDDDDVEFVKVRIRAQLSKQHPFRHEQHPGSRPVVGGVEAYLVRYFPAPLVESFVRHAPRQRRGRDAPRLR